MIFFWGKYLKLKQMMRQNYENFCHNDWLKSSEYVPHIEGRHLPRWRPIRYKGKVNLNRFLFGLFVQIFIRISYNVYCRELSVVFRF